MTLFITKSVYPLLGRLKKYWGHKLRVYPRHHYITAHSLYRSLSFPPSSFIFLLFYLHLYGQGALKKDWC